MSSKRKAHTAMTDASGGIATDTHLSVAAVAEARVAAAEARVAAVESENAKWRGYAEAWVSLCSEQARDALKERMLKEMSWAMFQREAIPGLPDHLVVEHILDRSDDMYFQDPANVAQLTTVSPAMRDAVKVSGLRVKELKEWEARILLCLSALRRIKQKGKLQYDETLCEAAAGLGQLEELKVLRENNTPWNWNTCAAATRGGHLKVLKWAHRNDCKWNAETCSAAAECGDLKILEWARKKGCKWDEKTCSAAALGGNLEVL